MTKPTSQEPFDGRHYMARHLRELYDSAKACAPRTAIHYYSEVSDAIDTLESLPLGSPVPGYRDLQAKLRALT